MFYFGLWIFGLGRENTSVFKTGGHAHVDIPLDAISSFLKAVRCPTKYVKRKQMNLWCWITITMQELRLSLLIYKMNSGKLPPCTLLHMAQCPTARETHFVRGHLTSWPPLAELLYKPMSYRIHWIWKYRLMSHPLQWKQIEWEIQRWLQVNPCP